MALAGVFDKTQKLYLPLVSFHSVLSLLPIYIRPCDAAIQFRLVVQDLKRTKKPFRYAVQ